MNEMPIFRHEWNVHVHHHMGRKQQKTVSAWIHPSDTMEGQSSVTWERWVSRGRQIHCRAWFPWAAAESGYVACSLLQQWAQGGAGRVLLCPMSESPSGKREGLQDNATGKKGKFITDSSQGPLPHPTQWCRSESPEPKLLHKFIG